MNSIFFKSICCMILMVVFMVITFLSKDALNSNISAMAVVLLGIFISKNLVPNNKDVDEK